MPIIVIALHCIVTGELLVSYVVYVHGSLTVCHSMARWKASCRFPISASSLNNFKWNEMNE